MVSQVTEPVKTEGEIWRACTHWRESRDEAKLNIGFEDYTSPGVYNPQLAHRGWNWNITAQVTLLKAYPKTRFWS